MAKEFISYADLDEPELPGRDDIKWLTHAKAHRAPLQDAANVEFWADTNLFCTQDWETCIFSAIDTCDIFILLVSPNPLCSDFIKAEESPHILDRQASSGIVETPTHFPTVLTQCSGLYAVDWLTR